MEQGLDLHRREGDQGGRRGGGAAVPAAGEERQRRRARARGRHAPTLRLGLSERRRERIADWLIVLGAGALFVSLFLTWSHQFSPSFLAQWGSSAQLTGVPHDPNAWQVYSAADVILALLAAGLVAVALAGGRRARIVATIGAAIAFAFTVHALGSPPTNGAVIFNSSLAVPRYAANTPTAGAGETVAIIGLILGLVGLVLSFTADWGR